MKSASLLEVQGSTLTTTYLVKLYDRFRGGRDLPGAPESFAKAWLDLDGANH